MHVITVVFLENISDIKLNVTNDHSNLQNVLASGAIQIDLCLTQTTVAFPLYKQTHLGDTEECDSGSPCGSEVHEKVTVVDPRHPDQLLILRYGLSNRGGERLQLWKLSLNRSGGEGVGQMVSHYK